VKPTVTAAHADHEAGADERAEGIAAATCGVGHAPFLEEAPRFDAELSQCASSAHHRPVGRAASGGEFGRTVLRRYSRRADAAIRRGRRGVLLRRGKGGFR
jgi:hypothetical protein